MIMKYKEVLDFLYSQLPMYQRVGGKAFKKNLDNIKRLTKYDNDSHLGFKSVHVAGTNGKGSVSHLLASILQASGYKVGLYTSPHLKSYRERIRINGVPISREEVVDYVSLRLDLFREVRPSFFEMTVAMAFHYFRKSEVDIAVIETGLGGRLDSTNVITPLVSVITNIGFDHTQFLGDSLPQIASEKAGIIKRGVPVVVGETSKDTRPVFEEKAEELDADIYFADDLYEIEGFEIDSDNMRVFDVYKCNRLVYDCVRCDLLGDYQFRNIITTLKTLELLSPKYIFLDSSVLSGLANVHANTGFTGRWQVLSYKPYIVADTAHNLAGLSYTVAQLRDLHYKKLHVVLGLTSDKMAENVLRLFPSDACFYLTKADVPRAMSLEDLAKGAEALDLKFKVYDSVATAFETAKSQLAHDDVLYVGGSTFVVAEVLP